MSNVLEQIKLIGLRDKLFTGKISLEEFMASDLRMVELEIDNKFWMEVCMINTSGFHALVTCWRGWLGRKLREKVLGKSLSISWDMKYHISTDEFLIIFLVSGLDGHYDHQLEFLLDGTPVTNEAFVIDAKEREILIRELADYNALHRLCRANFTWPEPTVKLTDFS